jgi:outer membrane protein TolC
MKGVIVILLSLFLPVIAPYLKCQDINEVLRVSVSQACEFALENNRTVQSSRIDISLAEKQISENLASGLPQVNLSANYLHQFVVPELSFGEVLDKDALPDGPVTGEDIRNAYVDSPVIPLGVKDNATFDFTVSQLIFSGQYLAGLKTVKVVRQISGKALVKTEDQIKEAVTGAYYYILVLRENIGLLKATGEALEKMYEEARETNREGLIEETDVDQMNINRSNIRALITSMESQHEIANKQFKYLLGIDFDREIELTESLEEILNQGKIAYDTYPGFRVENSIDFQITDIREDVSEHLLRLERSKYLPVVSAFYRHQEQTNQPSFNFAVKDVVGLTLTLPIFSSGSLSSKVSQARYDLQKARLDKQDAELGLIMEFETAKSNHQTAYSNFLINSESLNLSRKIYERTKIKYREGVSSSFELTQSQNQFLEAETNYYNSLLLLLRSKAVLDRILRLN